MLQFEAFGKASNAESKDLGSHCRMLIQRKMVILEGTFFHAVAHGGYITNPN